ncbi:MAG TPA: nitrilase-related carbon-nitrogen hydrolase, partial [Candidatus Limnocylindrales bacterium]|nr:nitrilase-related carbon-nitrogen hydrolase [Candidatus Limnocylindrales bacterium]
MPQLRLALAQVNPVVGDLAGNAAIVLDRTREAAAAGAHLVAFPEMVLTGYPIEDLALRWSFQQASITALDTLAVTLADEGLGDTAVIVGYLDLRDGGRDHPLGTPRGAPINAAAVLHGGQVVARYSKHHLPNYGVFDEFRYFVPGTDPCVVRIAG